MKIFKILIPLLLITSYSWAASYTIGSDPGDDYVSYAAFRAAHTEQAGDTVSFRKGDTFRETITLGASGTNGTEITYTAHGTGDNPVISAADEVVDSGWSVYSGSIYRKSLDVTRPTQLYVDGTYYDVAHYPETAATMLTTSATGSTTTVIDAELALSQANVEGADIYIKTHEWYMDASNVTSYNTGTHTMTISPAILRSPAYFEYYLTNKLAYLDSAGEWYYDDTNNYLYIWMPDSGSPSGHTIEISQRNYALNTNGYDYCIFENIDFEYANGTYERWPQSANSWVGSDVYVTSSSTDIDFHGCTFRGGMVGVAWSGATRIVVGGTSGNACTFTGCLFAGTLCNYGSSTSITASYNTVTNIAYVGTMPLYSFGALNAYGINNTYPAEVNYNTITNCGYHGIRLDGSGDASHNIISGAMQWFDDGGSIYTYGTSGTKTFTSNDIDNGWGWRTRASKGGEIKGVGIYFDENTQNVTATYNTIDDVDYGFFINQGQNNDFSHNTIRDAWAGIWLNRTVTTGITLTYNVIEGYAGYPFYLTSYPDSALWDFGTSDYNTFYHPSNADVVKLITYSPFTYHYYTLAEWQVASSEDANSTDVQGEAPEEIEVTGDVFTETSGNFTETNVVNGGNTIILTASETTWDATLGGDNAVSTAFLAGLECITGTGQTHGFVAELQVTLTFDDISRDSDTQVTVTLDAAAAYDIDQNEVWRWTIPATATAKGEAIIADPDITVSTVASGASAGGYTATYSASGLTATYDANGYIVTSD